MATLDTSQDAASGRLRPGPWSYRALWAPELIAMVMLAVVTVWAFTGTGLDIKVSAHYFNPSAAKPFSLHLVPPWTWLYDFVFIPLTVVLIGVLGAFIASLRNPRWRRWRLYAFFVLIALGLGPGLMVNGVLKAWWGRPRPRQIEQFRGPLKYHDAVSPGDISGRGKSFPCGHLSLIHI